MENIKDETDQDFIVEIRWMDGLFESFNAKQIRASSSSLFLRLTDGRPRNFPMINVRWWMSDPEIHGQYPDEKEGKEVDV